MTAVIPTPVWGNQVPRYSLTPEAPYSSLGDDAIDLAAQAGLILDPWQQHVLRGSMGEVARNRWAAFEVGLIVPRQNGKGSILEARELHALFLEPKTKLILHSAHEFKTAAEGFLRIKSLIDNSDFLRKRVKTIRTSHGEEGIELLDKTRLRFVARSTGSGRGFSGDLVFLDEAYALSSDAMAALMPTLSARPNPQLWYTSSAGMVKSTQLRKVRDRGRAGISGRLAYYEWCAHEKAMTGDQAGWVDANPGLGYRIQPDFIESEIEAMEEPEFRRERLGIWPDDGTGDIIPRDAWLACADPDSRPGSNLVIAVDASPDRRCAAISSSGMRDDGRIHTKVVEYRPAGDLGWVIDRISDLVDRYKPVAVILDPAGPIGSIISDLAAKGIEVVKVTAREMTQACGAFHDYAVTDKLRHCAQLVLDTALKSATTRTLGDAWAWDRRDSEGDISALVAATLAVWGYLTYGLGEVVEPWVDYR